MKYIALILSLFLSTPCFAAIGDTSGYNLAYSTGNIGDEQLSGSFTAIDPLADPPLPNTQSFLDWRQQRFDYYVNKASNATVDTTYYFSNSGSNANDGLTPATAKQTLSAANALLVSGQRTQILFDRGSKFLGGILAPANGTFKFGAYGSGAKPRITTFNSSGYLTTDSAWSVSSGNMYVKTSTPTKRIGWIREVASPYNPYMYVTTTTLCQQMPYSWTQTLTTATYTADNTTDVLTSAAHGLNNNDLS